jgi:two-component system LytT family response regulator
MIKALLVDDEKNALEMMEWLIRTYTPEVSIEATCTSALLAIDAIQKFNPDVVFLDIEMPMMNGFEMLEKIGKINFDVVFCTAYDQFAIKAFKYSALNYLLKPVDPDDLKSTVKRLQEKKNIPASEQFAMLLQQLKQQDRATPLRIALTTSDGLVFVPTADILYCEAESNYTLVVLDGGKKILVSKTLKEIDETLSGKDFYRVHSSYLVHIGRIKKFIRGDGGYLVMDNDVQVPISRSRKQDFMDRFPKF